MPIAASVVHAQPKQFMLGQHLESGSTDLADAPMPKMRESLSVACAVRIIDDAFPTDLSRWRADQIKYGYSRLECP